jgi:hypothetical protein
LLARALKIQELGLGEVVKYVRTEVDSASGSKTAAVETVPRP